MLRPLSMLFLVLLSGAAMGSLPLQASLADLACGAEHVLIGRVVGVDMIDGRGRQIRKESAMSGPGLKNQIRLIVSVDQVLDTNAQHVPKQIKVALDSVMHYSFGAVKAAHQQASGPQLVFLRGAAFQPIIAGRFLWGIDSRDEAMALRAKCKLAAG